MKIPSQISKVTLNEPSGYWIFPPIGFVEIDESADGAGNYYGLYWELGKENEEPTVCWMDHEQGSLVPEFKDLDSLLIWFEETESFSSPPIDLNDNNFFMNLYKKSKILTKNEKNDEAIIRLEKSINLFGEFCDSWTLLAENYWKLNEIEKAEVASLNSILTNYTFAIPSSKSIEQFDRIDPNGKLKNNPIVKRKEGLLKGGFYNNPFSVNYELLNEAIEEYYDIGDLRSAILLQQNYGYLMMFEPEKTRRRHDFEDKKWSEEFKNKVLENYPDRNYQ
jgi:hypothetical protein